MAMTSPLAHTCPSADSHASITTLRPLISFTLARTCRGTPSGVGVFSKPPVFLKSGDVVEITIEGIGMLTNPVAAEA